jgi:hypothetical protein
MDASLAGYPWLPRMIDKARADRAGTLGPYYRYPCPIDTVCLRGLGIDAQTFADIAASSRTDTDVVDSLRASGVNSPAVATFDPVGLNLRLHGGGS